MRSTVDEISDLERCSDTIISLHSDLSLAHRTAFGLYDDGSIGSTHTIDGSS